MTGSPAGKPTVSELGIDPAAQAWHRSGDGDGAIEVAFARAGDADQAEWVLMRVTGNTGSDSTGSGEAGPRVLVFDRHEWECFLDGARKGEFDAAANREVNAAAGHKTDAIAGHELGAISSHETGAIASHELDAATGYGTAAASHETDAAADR